MILAPVPRHDWRVVVTRLNTVTTRVVKPAAPNLLAQRKPFEVLQQLRVPRTVQGALDPSNPSDAEWQRLAGLPSLWFVRRRHLAYRDDYTGVWQEVRGIDDRATELALRSRLISDRLNLDAVTPIKPVMEALASTVVVSPVIRTAVPIAKTVVKTPVTAAKTAAKTKASTVKKPK